MMKRNSHEYIFPYEVKENRGSANIENRYLFSIVEDSRGWKSYILEMPNFGGKDQSTFKTHRVYDKQKNLYYISWYGNVRSASDMKAISALWVERMQRYMATGVGISV